MTPKHVTEGLWFPELDLRTTLGPGDARVAVAQALARGDDDVEPQGGGVLVFPEFLRSQPGEWLEAWGAPPFLDPIAVEHHGLMRKSYRWTLQLDGQRDGPWLRRGASAWLLSAPQERLFEIAALMGSAQTRSARLRLVGEAQQLADADSSIRLPARLLASPVRVFDQMVVEADVDGDEVVGIRAQGIDAETREAVELDAAAIGKLASGDGLVASSSVKTDQGEWLVAQPGVVRNLLLAAAANTADSDVKRRFIENPTAFLPDDAAFDVEGYSPRVLGVGEAPATTLAPESEPRTWAADQPVAVVLPDVDGREVVVPPDEVATVRDAVAEAVEAQEPTVTVAGQQVAATKALVEVLDKILEGKRPPGAPTEREVIRILLIAENEIALDWAPAGGDERATLQAQLPPLNVTLQAHQQIAIQHLMRLWQGGGTGALLCDDMGLGKTLQALTFGAWVAQQHLDRREVQIPLGIVAPPSLLAGWLQELEKRLPPGHLPTILWGASTLPAFATERTLIPLAEVLVNAKGKGVTLEHARVDGEALLRLRPSVLMVSYDQLRRLQFAIGQIRFGALVADEVQLAKNPNALRSRALRAMDADFGLALTGTPIENTWRDLWTICDFAIPGRLGTLQEFREAFPSSGDVRDNGERLADRLQSVLIRRTRKAALHGLPPCQITRAEEAMPPLQEAAYRGEQVRREREGTTMLELLQRLSSVSLHPRHRAAIDTAEEADAWAGESARTKVLWASLRRFATEPHAVLVFVRSKAMQKTLARAISLAFGLEHVGILNGDLSLGARTALVSGVEAAAGFRVLLVSPDVGGAGWNMQFAKRAVLLERPWNPAVEAQMIARIHRLGQDLPVEVVTPVAVADGFETFDVVLDALLVDKRELADSVLAPATVSAEELEGRFAGLATPRPSAPPPEAHATPAPPSRTRPASDTPLKRATLPPAPEPSEPHPSSLMVALEAAPRFEALVAAQPVDQMQRLRRVLTLLSRRAGGAMPLVAFAEAMSIKARRVDSLVARLGFFNVDGAQLLVADRAAGQVVLDLGLVRLAYDLG